MPVTINGTSGVVTATTFSGSSLSGIDTGKILQVVSATKTDTFSTSSSSFTDITGLSVAITPSSASNKIFLVVNLHGIGDSGTQMYVEILRTSDNTSVCIGDTRGSRVRASLGTGYYDQQNDVNSQGINFLDSPNTTSAFNYKLRTRTQGNGTIYINRSDQDHDSAQSGTLASTITAIEVAT
tara:strand:+ start:43 stop:588 length:546 start_codon:yes stop_codon:yes gene_type:complete